MSVFDAQYRIVALATPVLAHMHDAIEEEVDGVMGVPHIGRPIRYEGRTADANEIALRRMGEACRHAGFSRVELFPEPIAAAMSYLEGTRWRTGRPRSPSTSAAARST